jgi:hypothetical protein
MAQVAEADMAHLGLCPEPHVALRAALLSLVRGLFDITASLAAAKVAPAFDDSRPPESAPEQELEANVPAIHPPDSVREHK